MRPFKRPARPGLSRRALALARDVRLLVLDVDGVLTDNRLWLDEQGQSLKCFSIPDGMGLKLLERAGIEVAALSGLPNHQAEERLRQLGVTAFHGGHLRKLPVLERILSERGLDFPHLAYMGDDWLDAAPMRRAGLPMAPADAQPEILRLAAWVSRLPGGHGAVRDAVRLLLTAQGKREALWRDIAL
ncbi:3-deoxy-D-manno-octulosonate 8-phosphate phosphatase KdsC [Fundidesulfovibrio magnetotacticus]|uniref:3-deoxy-D-manno-octulosonate 8-phosphate phosphatase KdsC n=1 Tax=Fundidesulfovibrio magnetotacticus TaxID=2730080 RepID=A0A6V8LZT3_9BACT|nr:phenylphosphate carboxylase subunit delta [Fundidesulfovibrio magnetotacticus]GFK95137.1 3-deoxy-D-manno-octulosonate 8-phosphate phosphatase KdsC [Fundidesulfovibrio magnetotacticus]